MATIIEFRGSDRPSSVRNGGLRGPATAEVVIFPGVRIERWDAQPAKTATKLKSKPRRDLLEIE